MPAIDGLGAPPDVLTCPDPQVLHIDLNASWIDVPRLESFLLKTNGFETVRFCHGDGAESPEDLPVLIRGVRKFCRVIELSSPFADFPLQCIQDLISSGLDTLFVSVRAGHTFDDLRLRLNTLRNLRNEHTCGKPQVQFIYEITAANSDALLHLAELAHEFQVENVILHPTPMASSSLSEELPDLLRVIRNDYPAISIDASTCEGVSQSPLSAHPRFTARAISGRERVFSCLENPWDSARVLPNGDVVTCAARKHLAIGNLASESMAGIWQNKRYQEFRELYQLGTDSVCRQCPRKLAHIPGLLRPVLRPEEGNSIEFVAGWHWSEGKVIWSKPHSRCLLGTGPETGSEGSGEKFAELEGLLPGGTDTSPNDLIVSHKGRTVAAYRNSSTGIQPFLLAFTFVESGACAHFEFRVTRPYRPKESGSADGRELGFALVSLRGVVPPDRRLPRWRCVALYLALAAGHRADLFVQRFLAPALRCFRDKHRLTLPRERRPWRPGISIIIPECGTPELLRRALASVIEATALLDEESESIVVVNGAPLKLYEDHRRAFPRVHWLHEKKTCGFSGAVEKGVQHAKFDWVYLLNSDMTLDAKALAEVARWRAPRVFAVSSQVFFADHERRREETGWTNFTSGKDGCIELFDAEPEDNSTVRGHLYAGGGNSLFRRKLLRKYLAHSQPYNPAYWEDVEWGVRAWRSGYEVLFCPTSHVVHVHRSTVSKLFSERELTRIWKRNQFLFSIRNSFQHPSVNGDPLPDRAAVRHLRAAFDPNTQREVAAIRQVGSLFRSLISNAVALAPKVDFSHVCQKYFLRPESRPDTRPAALVVSPFAVYPAAHGGARRIANLIEQLSVAFDVVLVTDEESAYTPEHIAAARGPISIHITGGRSDPARPAGDRRSRIRAHSHARLRDEMERLASVHKAALIQIEYIELAGLIGHSRHSAAYVLDLHDVLLSKGMQTEEDIYERALMAQHDAVLVCSHEDARLVSHERIAVVPNGFTPKPREYRPSRGTRMILFAGPFRYAPNFVGIRHFLEHVFPPLREAVPGLELTILGGKGSRSIAVNYSCFEQPAVTLVDSPVDPECWLERCALTINPLADVRGSSLKVIESIGFGRICVSTTDGARGFGELKAKSLITVPEVHDFYVPVRRLLLDEDLRLHLERPDHQLLSDLSWEDIGRRHRLLYQQWFGLGRERTQQQGVPS